MIGAARRDPTMKKMFALDSPLMMALATLADLMFCNVLFCLLSLPLFTVGASLTALYECTISIVEQREDTSIILQFWKAFRRNFKRGTWLGLICIGAFALLWGYQAAVGLLSGGLQRMYRVTFLVLAFLWLAVFQYIFPLQAKFHMPVGQTLKTAALLSAAALPWTLASLAVTAGTVYLSFLMDPNRLGIAVFLWFFVIIAVVAYLNSFFFRQAFKRLAPEGDGPGGPV